MIYQFEHFGQENYFTIEENENLSYPKHLHKSFELVLILSGKMRLSVGDEIYRLHKGDAFFLFPNQIHSFVSEGFSHKLFIFSPSLIGTYSRHYEGKVPTNNLFHLSEPLLTLLNRLTTDSSQYEIKGALYSVCAEFDRQTTYRDVQSDKRNLLFYIFDFVDKNFKNSCRLTDLANSIHYHHSYICRYFKQSVGISYNQYLNMHRLSYAAYLLKNTSCTVTEAAFESGYQSIKTFSHNFKKQYNISPAQYAKK